MTRMNRICGATVVLMLVAAITVAPPAWALEKVGTTSMQVLKIPMGVRGIAMGNALCAAATDAEAVWWNPGALTEMKGTQAILAHINLPADIQLNSVVLAHRWGDYSVVSLHAISLATDAMPVRTWDRPQGTGEEFNAYDFILGASFARQLTDRFSLGGNVRYLRSGLEQETYDGVAVDLGTLYKTGLRSLRVGMAIQNLGPDVKYSGTFLDYRNRIINDGELRQEKFEGANLPTVFRLGMAFDAFEMFGVVRPPDWTGDLSVEMNHPNDNRERLNLGGEAVYRHMLYLRLGGKFAYDEESVAGGFGLRIPVSNVLKVRFDYAYSHWGRIGEAADDFMGQPHRLALGFEW
jgi:hypothetical protein